MSTQFKVGQIWNRRDGARVTVNSVAPPRIRVAHIGRHCITSYVVDFEGRHAVRPHAYDLIDLAQASPVCAACEGNGCYHVADRFDPETGPEVETAMCEDCNGTGKALVFYIAGPMTGYPDLNFPAFHAKAAELRAAGYEVINPAEINGGEDELVACASMAPEELAAHWRKCMRNDIKAVCDCDGIAMLDGWTRSKGATLEHHVALALGLIVFEAGA